MDDGALDALAEPLQPAPEEAQIYAPLDPEATNEPTAPWYEYDPLVIAHGQEGVRNLAVSPHGLFWIADRGGEPVLHRSTPMGQVQVVHLAIGSSPIDAVTMGGVPVYEDGGSIFRLTADSFAPEKLITFTAAPVDLAVHGSDLYVATDDGCVHALIDGADGFESLACGGGEPLTLAVHEDGVWWGSNDGFVYHAVEGVAEPVTKPGDPSQLVVDTSHVYWAAGTQVLRAPRTGLGKIAVAAESQGQIVSLTGDRFFLYYASSDDGAIWRKDKTTGAAVRLSYGWDHPSELVLATAGRLYWVDPVAGTVVTQRL